MKQKFLKDDGTIEEGEPLSNAQASMLEELTNYLHQVVCENSYHSVYKTKPCQVAAQFIMTVTTTIDQSEWGEVFEEKVNPKPKPAPIPEPVPTVKENNPDEIPW